MNYLQECIKKDKIFLEGSVIIYINIQSKPIYYDYVGRQYPYHLTDYNSEKNGGLSVHQ